MSRVVLSIGSNMGDPLVHLRSVVSALGDRVIAASSVYATAPWGGVEQQDFLNATVIAEDPDLDCWGWLRLGQELESAADRVREQRWGPRSLDVDVVDCDGTVSADARLTLPHPRAHERAFVLAPWLEVDPDAALVVAGETVAARDLLAGLDPAERDGVRRTELRLVSP
ncbi:2-amino-4-hydroxy-6-hydroxymethyldihydropteridine diphosphokinase [Rhodococcus kronopolitis]|uniref:2-amino-4-hydroxy-6-hydroxymethyldihydropteridine diphosphokinase n=1 Tax=Rhodococcus kronopolitis TaxID=1460226 RepID=A0ABV9FSF8_9NOCA